MIAIPLDKKDSTTISKLYGKAPFFALLDSKTGTFKVIENGVKGNGPKAAPFLKEHGVSSTIFYHMGEGVYNECSKNSIDVFTSEHSTCSIDEIYRNYLNKSLLKLDETNYKELLDPGESGSCVCGCEK